MGPVSPGKSPRVGVGVGDWLAGPGSALRGKRSYAIMESLWCLLSTSHLKWRKGAANWSLAEILGRRWAEYKLAKSTGRSS